MAEPIESQERGFLKRHGRVVALVTIGVTGLVLLEFVPPESAILRAILRLGASALLAVPPFYSLYRADERANQEAGIGLLRRLLPPAIAELFPNENLASVRANLMLANAEKLTMLVFTDNVYLYGDNDLEWGYGQGVAGKAWKRGTEAPPEDMWKPLTTVLQGVKRETLRNEWGLTDEQIEKTRHVKWISSVPIIVRAGNERRCAGVLNFDGVGTALKNMGRLDEDEYLGITARLANEMGKIMQQKGIISLDTAHRNP